MDYLQSAHLKHSVLGGLSQRVKIGRDICGEWTPPSSTTAKDLPPLPPPPSKSISAASAKEQRPEAALT